MNTTTWGATAAMCSQVTRSDGAPGQPSTASAPATCSISGTQWPPLTGGSPHSRANTRGRSSPATAAWTPIESLPQPGHDLLGLLGDAGGLADLPHAVQDLVQGAGVQGEDLGLAAQDVQGLGDLAGGDGADRTQVLGQDQLGAQLADGLGVEPVDRLAAADAGADQPVDLGRVGDGWQRRVRHDLDGAGLGGQSHSSVTPTRCSASPRA